LRLHRAHGRLPAPIRLDSIAAERGRPNMPRIEPIPYDKLSDAQRAMIEGGMASGAFRLALPLQILAYSDHENVPDDGDRHPNYPRHLLDGKLLELLRIRSAQLGGCEPCMGSRKVPGATEEAVACLTNPALRGDLSDRERLALEFLDLLATDHHRIGDDLYRRMAKVFTTAEIVELGSTCGHMIGTHRFLHTIDVFGDSDPVIPYAEEQVGATWAELQSLAAE
jgi:alkylhydroperoxidase family enzyme